MKDERWVRLNEILKIENIDSLISDDRAFVEREIGMDAFRRIHNLKHELVAEQHRPVKPALKKKLVAQMRGKYVPFWYSVFNRRTPIWSHVVQALLLVPFVWLVLPEKEVLVENKVVEVVNKVDTIEIQLPSDTVYIENLVRVEVPVYLTRNESLVENPTIKEVSIADKKSLQNLIVSGK